MRFGLRQESNCPNCPEPNESIKHKKIDCIEAREARIELDGVKSSLNLSSLSDLSIENLIGGKDDVSKLELAVNAELIHRLTTRNEAFDPKALVKSVIKLVGYSERLGLMANEKFKDVLMNWN